MSECESDYLVRNMRLQDELSEAHAMIAMQAEALSNVLDYLCGMRIDLHPILQQEVNNALSTTSETVAAWRAKETEPLRREVAMQYEMLCRIGSGELPWSLKDVKQICTDTQATALAYEREVKAKTLEEAAESAPDDASEKYCRSRAAELRAANNGELK